MIEADEIARVLTEDSFAERAKANKHNSKAKPAIAVTQSEVKPDHDGLNSSQASTSSSESLGILGVTKSFVRKLLLNPRFLASVLLCLGIALFICIFALGARALGTQEAIRNGFTWTRISLPLDTRSCDDLTWPLRIISIIVNLFSTIVMVFSGTIQRLCTSPDIMEIRNEMLRKGDFDFGSNNPIMIYKRKHWGSLSVWLVMVTTSLPLHLLINAVIGQSNEFSSIEALADQTETGVCRIVMRPWIGFVIAVMVIIKAIVILIYLRYNDSLQQEKYNTLGDIIYASVGNPELTGGLPSMQHSSHGIMESKKASNLLKVYQQTRKPHNIRRIALEHITWADAFTVIGMIVMAVSVLLDVAVNYESPQGFSVLKQIEVILAVNIPQFAFSGLLFLFQDALNRWYLEREWQAFAKQKKLPRITLHGRAGRDTRFLTIPFWAGLAMIGYSTLCHFAVTQMQDIAEIYIQPDIILMGFTWSAQRAAFIMTLYVLPFLPIVLLLVMWTCPQRTYMPVMQGSGRVVLAACKQLSSLRNLPEGGIQWGDIGESVDQPGVRLAGFASEPGTIRPDSYYF